MCWSGVGVRCAAVLLSILPMPGFLDCIQWYCWYNPVYVDMRKMIVYIACIAASVSK